MTLNISPLMERIRSTMIDQIMQKIATLENRANRPLQDWCPSLEAEIQEAIASHYIAKLEAVLRKLDDFA